MITTTSFCPAFTRVSSILLVISAVGSTTAQAKNLIDIYQEAINYDASLAAAESGMLATREDIDIARATLLPTLSLTASGTHADQTSGADQGGSDFSSTLNQFIAGSNDSYMTSNVAATLTQPIFRAKNWFAFKSSKWLSKKSEADFSKAQQDLIINVATAYFNILRAEENLATNKSAESAFKRQWEQARERFDVGLIAITEVQESRASFDRSTTSRIQTEGQLDIAIEQLGQLTGEIHTDIAFLNEKFPIVQISPLDPKTWVEKAYQQNWSIKSAESTLEQKKQSLKGEKAGHLPTVDLSASFGHSRYTGPAPSTGLINKSSVTLSFNMPLYQGGGTQANIRKARFLVNQARHLLENSRRTIKLNTRTLLTTLKTDIDTVNSRKQTTVSSKSALEATNAGYKVGTRNIVEVLNAEKNYFSALGDYANARFDYVIDSLKIKQAVGTLSPQDLIDLNHWLVAK